MDRELSARTLVVGALVGIPIALGNLYLGLKTGWWDFGTITASILGFAILASLDRSRSPTAQETTMTQAIAASVGAMPSACGFLGALPALGFLGRHYPWWIIAAWGILMAILGLAIGAMLRERLIEKENLPFPTGQATAQVIEAMRASRADVSRHTRALVYAALVTMIVVWFRDAKPSWIPDYTALPGVIAGVSLVSLRFGFAWSPLMFGSGILVGLRLGLSILLGAVIAWGVGGILLVHAGVVHAASYDELRDWLVWPGASLMASASLCDLLFDAPTLVRSLRSLAPGRGGRVAWIAVAAIGVILLGWRAFGVSPLVGLAALALSIVLASVCARAAGQTDSAPFGAAGQMAQLALMSGTKTAEANIAGASVSAGDAVHATMTLYAFRVGSRFGASPRRLIVGQFAGAIVGAGVAIVGYRLLERAYGIGGGALPVPPARVWKSVADVVAKGISAALPPGAGRWVVIAAVIGVVLAVAERTRLGRILPSAVAMGVAFIMPANFAVTTAAGATLAFILKRRSPEFAERQVPSLAAGVIAGESLMGILVALLIATNVLGKG